MSVLFRARVASFMTGVAVTSVHAIYQLKKELVQSQDVLINQVSSSVSEVDKRVSKLELAVAALASTEQKQ